MSTFTIRTARPADQAAAHHVCLKTGGPEPHEAHPSHMHIDLLERARGRGHGRRMMEEVMARPLRYHHLHGECPPDPRCFAPPLAEGATAA